MMEDNLQDLVQHPEKLNAALTELTADITGFEKSLERLARLGKIARDAYARPPDVSRDGTSSEGMYYFKTS
jgi:hypothetical protein